MSQSREKKPWPPEAVDATDPQAEGLSQAEDVSFREAYENTPVMMHSLGANQKIVSVNRHWLAVMGYQEDEVIGRNASDFLTEESLRYVVEVAWPQLRETGAVRDVPYQMVKKNGDTVDVFLSAVAVSDSSGQFVRSYSYMSNANNHVESDDLRRQLSLVEEHNRMSHEFHESVEHSLIGIIHQTERISQLMDSDPSMAKSELMSAKSLAEFGLEQAHHAAWNIEPLTITSRPLQDVISLGLSRVEDEGIKTTLAVDGDEPSNIDKRNKMVVTRIAQEALNNIISHSRASMVKVSLSYTRSHLMLLITDDGVGFDTATTPCAIFPSSSGTGTTNIRESARFAGGSVSLRSAPGSGTEVEVCIPFEHDPELTPISIERTPNEEPPALTNRELEVLRILAYGGRNKDVAAKMFVSIHTVKFHIENLYEKLDVRTRAELIRVATQRGLLAI